MSALQTQFPIDYEPLSIKTTKDDATVINQYLTSLWKEKAGRYADHVLVCPQFVVLFFLLRQEEECDHGLWHSLEIFSLVSFMSSRGRKECLLTRSMLIKI